MQSLLEITQIPVLSAFVLGLMTAISPCPLATNITAIGFIGQNISQRKRVFISGIFYTMGRILSYMSIGMFFFFWGKEVKLSGFLQQYGEKILGPLLLLIGLFMLGLFSFTGPSFGKFLDRLESKEKNTYWGAFFLGIIFALAFCPYSGVLYFGILIPMVLGSPNGLFLPFVFALATAIPVVLFAWLIAFSFGLIGSIYNKVKIVEQWSRKIIAVLFLFVGIYYIISVYLLI